MADYFKYLMSGNYSMMTLFDQNTKKTGKPQIHCKQGTDKFLIK